MTIPNEILTVLCAYRYPLQDEKALQQLIQQKMVEHNVSFSREVPLVDNEGESCGVIDFMCGDIGIEVKLKGQKKAIYRQVAKYCESTSVRTLILLTNRSMGLPCEINSKPCTVLSLGIAHL